MTSRDDTFLTEITPGIRERIKPAVELPGRILRFGANILDRVLLRPHELEQLAITNLVRQENETIDIRSAAFRSNIFRTRGLDADHEAQAELMAELEQDLSTCETIADRFAVFLDDHYADDAASLDLGETQRAGSHEAVEALKDEYHELEDSISSAGFISGELTRKAAKPTVHFNDSTHPDYCHGTRNRTLFSFEENGRRVTVAKRMSFLMKKTDVPATLREGKQNISAAAKFTQPFIDQQDESIIPIRTVYYVKIKQRDT